MKGKSLKKNAFLNFLKSFMNIVFPIISFPYASRVLLPQGIGKVNFANSIIEYFVLIAALGIETYATREAAKIRDNKQKLNAFSREILFINLFSTITAYIALLLCFLIVPKFYEYRLLIIICSTKVLFKTAGMEWLYRSKEEYGYITIRQTVFQIMSLILLFALVKTPEDYNIYAGIGVFANVGANILNLSYSRKFINLFERTKIKATRHIKPIFTFFGIDCAGKINSALDAVMLGFILGDRAVGFYSAAIKINRMVIELITSAVSSFMPRSAYYLENNQQDEYKKMISKACIATYFFSFPAAAGLFFLCEPIILLFCGEQYLPAVPSMKILSIAIIGLSSNSFLNNLIIIPQRKEKFTLIAQITAACTNIILNSLLIPRYEVFGAAIATLTVDFILPFIVLIPAWKFVSSIHNAIEITKSFICTILMLTILTFICKDIQNILVKTFVAITVGGLSYAICTIIIKHETSIILFNIIRKKIKIMK